MTPTGTRSAVTMTDAEIADFLAAPRTVVLASIGPDGLPHLSSLWYVTHEQQLAMWTYARSQKVLNLRRDPRATLLVETGQTYDTLRGVAIDATASLLDAPDDVLALGLELNAKYPGAPAHSSARNVLDGVRRQAAKRVGLVFTPLRYRSWDHSKL